MDKNKKINTIKDIVLVLLFILVIGSIILFNYFVNPYSIFKSPEIKGFNNIKIHKLTSKRSVIFSDFKLNAKGKEIAFVGNCLFEDLDLGLDNVIFATIPMVKPSETIQIIKVLNETAPSIKKIYLGVAFDELWNDKNDEITDELPEWKSNNINYKDIINLLFSWNTTKYSIETVQASMKNKGEEQHFVYPYKEIGKKEYNTEFSLDILNTIKEIIEYTKANNIDLIVYYSPVHVTKKIHIYEKGQWENNIKFKKQLALITPYYDYSLFNGYNHFPLDENSEYFIDNLHMTKIYNNMILKDILSDNKKYGQLITADNVNQISDEDTKELENYIKANKELSEVIKNVTDKDVNIKIPSKNY